MACFYIGYGIPVREITRKSRENYAKTTRKLREKTIDIKNMLNLDHLEITVEGYHGNVSLVVYPKSMSKKMCIFAILK